MVLDSNIVIAYLSGEEIVINLLDPLREEGKSLFISTITECEVLSFPKFTKSELAITEEFLTNNLITVPFDSPISRIAARLRRECVIKTADAAIAATAIYLKLPILTRDHHLSKIKDLVIVEV